MTITALALFPAVQLAAAVAALYTTGVNKTAIVKRVVFVNTTANARLITVYAVPNAGSPTASNTVISARGLSPGESYVSPELAGLTLPAGASLQAFSDAANAVTVYGSGVEVT